MSTPADLSDAYANMPYIPDAASFPPRWAAEAAELRAELGARAMLGLPYGGGAREWFDLFLPVAAPHGVMVFVHGGYWKAFEPRLWSAFATGALARGWAVAMPGYTLAPDARITDITAQVARAVDAIAARVPTGPMVLTGHSAGGHLAARMVCRDITLACLNRVARVLPISPVSDLTPLMQCDFNSILRIDADEAQRESPALLPCRAGIDTHIWVGSAERPVFLDQARWLGSAWDAPVTVDGGRHHFDVIDGLTDPDSPMLCVALGGL